MKVRILPEAESDLARAADFYDAQRFGLGNWLLFEALGTRRCQSVHS